MLRAISNGVASEANAVASVQSIAALRAYDYTTLNDGDVVWVSSYYSVANNKPDGGEGAFVWKASSSSIDNQGTIIKPTANSGNGRYLRLRTGVMEGYFNVLWYGAIGSGNTADAGTNATAIDYAITDAGTTKRSTQAINTVYFPPGLYFTNKTHEFDRTLVAITGAGAGLSRVVHTTTATKGPVFYLSGGQRFTAAPYGGISKIQVGGNTNTSPAVIYMNDVIDNLFKLDDLWVSGGAAKCDGLGLYEFLNAHSNVLRLDSISGYGLRFRIGYAGTGAFNIAISTTDGTISTPTNSPLGAAAALFSTGTLPTDPLTALPLKGANAASGAGIYFLGKVVSSITSSGRYTLHRTRADAIAGINPIIPSDVGSGTHGMSVFSQSFNVSAVDTTADTLTYDHFAGCMVSKFSPETVTTNIGTTYAGTGGLTWTGGTRVIVLYGDGTPPAGLSYGVPYYPIWVSGAVIKVASTAANATAGTGIDITATYTGNMYICHFESTSTGGIGSFVINQMTYDNNAAATIETVNGVDTGGLGVLFYSNYGLAKGSITVDGHRVEINKAPAVDRDFAKVRSSFRIQGQYGQNNNDAAPNVSLSLKNIQIDTSVSVSTNLIQTFGIVSSNDDYDCAPSFDNVLANIYGFAYTNDSGTAFNSQPLNKAKALINYSKPYVKNGTTEFRLEQAQVSTLFGVSMQRYANSQYANSYFKTGDIVMSADAPTLFYKAMGANKGWGRSDGTVSIGATVTGTAGSSIFTLSGTPSVNQFTNGVAVKIAGAGVASADLIGIVGALETLAATKTFMLSDPATGLPLACSTSVAAAACTFMAQPLATVPVWYEISGTFNPGALAAGASTTATFNAPTGVTLTASNQVIMGMPSNVQAGLIYKAFVTSGGASVTLQAYNPTANPITQSSATWRFIVRA